MPLPLLRNLRANIPSATFYNLYGQTEANSSTYYRIDEIPEDDGWRIPIGRAFPGFDVFALDDEGAVVEPGATGELYVCADSVGLGYLHAPEKTAAKYVADPRDPNRPSKVYRTGDRVRLEPNGNYVYLGRTDNLIKSRGYRVELGEVELALMAAAGVRRAVVVPIPDDLIGNRLIAFVQPEAGAEIEPEMALESCRTRLPAYMVPERLEVHLDLPKTSSGKIDRQRVKYLATKKSGL